MKRGEARGETSIEADHSSAVVNIEKEGLPSVSEPNQNGEDWTGGREVIHQNPSDSVRYAGSDQAHSSPYLLPSPSQIDPSVVNALPLEMRREIMAITDRALLEKGVKRSRETGGGDLEREKTNVINFFASKGRKRGKLQSKAEYDSGPVDKLPESSKPSVLSPMPSLTQQVRCLRCIHISAPFLILW
jgi:hypothetical protein